MKANEILDPTESAKKLPTDPGLYSKGDLWILFIANLINMTSRMQSPKISVKPGSKK